MSQEEAVSDRSEPVAIARVPDWLVRQHRCNADGAMTVGECIDTGRCRCSCGLYLAPQPSTE